MNPPITIILPTLNERQHIRDCLDSLLAQDYQNIVEILVVDGGSTDGTRDIVSAEGGVVRLLDNPRMTAAAAMNIGIEACSTDLFVRVDAHTLYATDYVSRSVATSVETGASVVGGPMRPEGTNPFGRAVAAVTTSPLGIGPGKFHYGTELEEVETVYLGIFNRAEVLAVGGYDETNLQWAAEDQELNYRIRKAGGRIVLDPRIRSTYFPRSTPRALARQYHNYGMCKASTLRKHRTLPYWRPVIPAGMVLAVVLWVLLSFALGLPVLAPLPFVAYGVAAVALGFRFAGQRGVTWHRAAIALTICHWTYGFGLWRGVGRIVTGRAFDNRPKGGRR
jgi:glycosyltransferase involved in cell wall biosynthesis